MRYTCVKTFDTALPSRDGTVPEEKGRTVHIASLWELEGSTGGHYVKLSRINTVTGKPPMEPDTIEIPAYHFTGLFAPDLEGYKGLWKCTGPLSIDAFDDGSGKMEFGASVEVPEDSVWELDTTGATVLSADVHLDSQEGGRWIEMGLDAFLKSFRPVTGTPGKEGQP